MTGSARQAILLAAIVGIAASLAMPALADTYQKITWDVKSPNAGPGRPPGSSGHLKADPVDMPAGAKASPRGRDQDRNRVGGGLSTGRQ